MPLSLRARIWRAILPVIFGKRPPTLAAHRARDEKLSQSAPPPKGMQVEMVDANGIRAAWFRPQNAPGNRALLYLHGGGYVLGSIETRKMMCALMADSLGMNVLAIDYRLAPENPYPAALEDARKAFLWLLAEGFAAENLLIAGDSAGGGLSLATALSLRDNGEPLPGGVVCLSPWADLTNRAASHHTKAASDPILQTDLLDEWARYYTEEANLQNALVSPVFANFDNFPPLLIQAGSEEILLDDALTLAKKAQVAGVDVTLSIWQGLWHVWPALGDLIPESRAAFEEIKDWSNSR
jgi:epsilon-lactone hydrolase